MKISKLLASIGMIYLTTGSHGYLTGTNNTCLGLKACQSLSENTKNIDLKAYQCNETFSKGIAKDLKNQVKNSLKNLSCYRKAKPDDSEITMYNQLIESEYSGWLSAYNYLIAAFLRKDLWATNMIAVDKQVIKNLPELTTSDIDNLARDFEIATNGIYETLSTMNGVAKKLPSMGEEKKVEMKEYLKEAAPFMLKMYHDDLKELHNKITKTPPSKEEKPFLVLFANGKNLEIQEKKPSDKMSKEEMEKIFCILPSQKDK